MHLKLINVRQHKQLELDFPDKGICLIKAPSGTGKSTILDSIMDALWESEHDLVPWDGKSCEIHMSFLGAEIKRTHGPKTLTLKNANGAIFKDDAAQNIISRQFGLTFEEFDICGYVRQGMSGSLLTLEPAKKLKLIQSLSNGLCDVDKVKQIIAKKIQSTDSDLKQAQQDLSYVTSLKQQYQQDVDVLTNKINALSDDVPEFDQGQLDILRETQKNCNKTYTELANQVNELTIKLNNPLYKELVTNQIRKDTLIKDINQNTGLLQKLKDRPKNETVPWQKLSQAQIKDERKKIQIKRTMLECKQNLIKEAAAIHELYPESKLIKGKLNGYLEEKQVTLDADISSAQNSIQTLNSKKIDLGNLKIPQKCPACDVPLNVVQGMIQLAVAVPDDLEDQKKSLTEEIDFVSKQIKVTKATKDKLSKILNNVEYLKSIMPSSDPMPETDSFEKLKKAEDELSTYETEQRNLERQKDSADKEIQLIENLIIKSQKDIVEIDKKIEQGKTLEPVEILKEVQKEVLGKMDIQFNSQQTIHKSISEMENNRRQLESLEQEKGHLGEWELKLNEAKTKEIDCEKKVKGIQDKLIFSRRLKELSDFAAVSSIQHTIEVINSNSQKFLDQMFAKDGTTIKLNNTKITQKGEEKAEISIDIFHKGQEVKRLKSMSGGEKTRSCLAFQMGLSELYKLPILMIDEGFTGLEENDRRICFEILKMVSQDKLILVIEHDAPEEFFDQVYDLETLV